MIFEQLINLSENRKIFEVMLKKRMQDFENTIVLDKAKLKDMYDEEAELREEAILELEKENKTSKKVGNKTIIKQIKKTFRIIDVEKLKKIIFNYKVDDYGFDNIEIMNSFKDEVIINNKELINQFIEAVNNIDGHILDGVEEHNTKYILIK